MDLGDTSLTRRDSSWQRMLVRMPSALFIVVQSVTLDSLCSGSTQTRLDLTPMLTVNAVFADPFPLRRRYCKAALQLLYVLPRSVCLRLISHSQFASQSHPMTITCWQTGKPESSRFHQSQLTKEQETTELVACQIDSLRSTSRPDPVRLCGPW